jgi:hypothetical protein
VFSRFSLKKTKKENQAQLNALMMVEHSIKTELETYVSHLQTVQMSYDNIQKQNVEIIKLLKEKKQDG